MKGKPIRLKHCIHVAATDIDPGGTTNVKHVDALVNGSVLAARNALDNSCSRLTEFHRKHLSEIFVSLKHTYDAIRYLIRKGHQSPITVDAMALARIQLETIYAIALIAEKPESLDIYIKNHWKGHYLRFLHERENYKNLSNRKNFYFTQGILILEKLRKDCGVSDDEKSTIDSDELGIPLPAGTSAKKIEDFPTPTRALERIKTVETRKMLTYLYPEYRHLCSFVHLSPLPKFLKGIFDDRSRYSSLFSQGEREEIFHKAVADEALWIGFLSIAQCAAELICFYPNDLELRKTVGDCWEVLSKSSFPAKSVYEIRTKSLIGII